MQTANESANNQPTEDPPKTEPTVAQAEPPAEAAQRRISPRVAASMKNMNSAPGISILDQAVDTLVSAQVTHEQKQAAWKQLLDSGKLDQSITELEQRATGDPRSSEIAATLGQAYLKKCGTLQDVREQAILAMQADKAFDTALSLDPANWEARFTKAVAMSYWPANLNKGEEVIQHFETLVQQQETQAPQPQFAETYAWLGDQYRKAGRADDARAIWQRGAELFPNNDALKTKLASVQ
jgi:tetratricopeptide (TPR) repeat protein